MRPGLHKNLWHHKKKARETGRLFRVDLRISAALKQRLPWFFTMQRYYAGLTILYPKGFQVKMTYRTYKHTEHLKTFCVSLQWKNVYKMCITHCGFTTSWQRRDRADRVAFHSYILCFYSYLVHCVTAAAASSDRWTLRWPLNPGFTAFLFSSKPVHSIQNE